MDNRSIGDVFEYISRGKSPQYVDHSSVHVINQACIRWDGIDFSKVKYQNPTNIKKDAILSIGDLLISSTGTGTLGRCCVFDGGDESITYIADSHVTIVRKSDMMLPSFAKYYLMHDATQRELYAQCVNGSTNQIELSKEKFKKFPIPVPSRESQHSIVTILEKIEELISLRKDQLAKLDELVKARFVEMFGDVVHNTKHWPVHRFSDITTSRLGKMLDTKCQTGENSYPYMANFNVQWFRFNLENLNQMDFTEKDRIEFELQEGDLLVCEGGEIGRCAIWHNEIQPCYFQKALHRVRCDKEQILPYYLAWWFKFNCEHNGFAEIEGAKATIAHLPGAKLKVLPVVVPPLELQEKFTFFVEQTDKRKLTLQESLGRLEVMKKALMQLYFG